MLPSAQNESAIVVSSLSKKYGNETVVDNISFTVDRGETLALIGTSGSGKTTILKSINGLIPRTSGEIKVYGKSIDDWDTVELRRRIGYVIQEVGLFPHYTIERNIRLVPELLGWNKDAITAATDEWLQRLSIPSNLKSRFPDALSGGQQQRVGLARAMVADPEIVLMDEPFGALDPIIRSGLQREFRSMKGMESRAIVIVTHDMLEAAILGDRICLLDGGRLQQIGTLQELLFSPANDFVKKFLDPQRDSLEMKAIRFSAMKPFMPATLWQQIASEDMILADVSTELANDVKRIFYLNRSEIISNSIKT